MRSTVVRTQDAMATEWAALNMEAWAKRRMQTFEDAERGLVFGRLSLDANPRPLYVGRRWVTDDKQESLVVNWQAPAARPFYTATPQDPHGVTQRRRFRTEGRRVLGIADESLDGSIVDGRRSATSCSRSWSAGESATCATSSRRSRPIST